MIMVTVAFVLIRTPLLEEFLESSNNSACTTHGEVHTPLRSR